jgi:hypothetical protein
MVLWFKFFWYLRIFDSTNYIARMVIETIKGMKVFFLIFLMSHLAFAHASYYINILAQEQHRDYPEKDYLWAWF